MRINNTTPTGAKPHIKKAKSATSTFDIGESQTTSAPTATSSVHAPNALLLLQNIESSDPDLVKKKGEQLLNYLEDLQKGLLKNQVSKETLELMLDTIKNQQSKCDNPQLMETLEMIEQRASIELAKLNYEPIQR